MKKDWVVAQEDFGGDEAAADGVKEGGVGGGAESVRDVGSERLRLELG